MGVGMEGRRKCVGRERGREGGRMVEGKGERPFDVQERGNWE